MKLICYSDASYLNETKARSRCGGYFYLGDANISSLNGPVLSRRSVIGAVTSSAAESELAAAFMNAREAVYLRNILEACGYPTGDPHRHRQCLCLRGCKRHVQSETLTRQGHEVPLAA
jgi:hypothetical protein